MKDIFTHFAGLLSLLICSIGAFILSEQATTPEIKSFSLLVSGFLILTVILFLVRFFLGQKLRSERVRFPHWK